MSPWKLETCHVWQPFCPASRRRSTNRPKGASLFAEPQRGALQSSRAPSADTPPIALGQTSCAPYPQYPLSAAAPDCSPYARWPPSAGGPSWQTRAQHARSTTDGRRLPFRRCWYRHGHSCKGVCSATGVSLLVYQVEATHCPLCMSVGSPGMPFSLR